MNNLALRTREEWEQFERFGRAMQAAQWRFARTMPKIPHCYTLRKDWLDEDEFLWAARFIDKNGYEKRFGKASYTYFDANEHHYWGIWDADENGRLIYDDPGGLINRARRKDRHVYDTVAHRYDVMYWNSEAVQEDLELFGIIDDVAPRPHGSVLDVGCGMGHYLAYGMADRYIGLDPSSGMLRELRHRHPDAPVVHTDLLRFAPPKGNDRYDLIVALHGVGAYLTDAERARIPHLLKPGGVAVVMFYHDDQQPDTYERAKVEPPAHRPYDPDILPAEEVVNFRIYDIAIVRGDEA